MPSVVARAAYFHCCKYISSKLRSIICSSDVSSVNTNGIKGFSLDVDVCIEFADRCPLVDKKDEMLANVFSELRELVDLIVDRDWNGFSNTSVRASKYRNLKPSTVLTVIEKLDDSIKNPSRQQKREEKERKKELDLFKRNVAQLSM